MEDYEHKVYSTKVKANPVLHRYKCYESEITM